MARTHKTMRGKVINMDTLRILNEKEVALGNMKVNARGDKLGPGGVIVKDANKRIREENALHTMVPGKAPVSKNKDELNQKTAAKKAAEVEEAAAAQILADADKTVDADAPKGGLAASLAEAPSKKKRAPKKKAAE